MSGPVSHADDVTTLTRGSFALSVRFRRRCWPVLYADQWFLPRLQIDVVNQGPCIEHGRLECEIRRFPEEFATITSVEDGFQGVGGYPLDDFKPGETCRHSLVIPSKFLRPNTYMLRSRLVTYRPAGTFAEQLAEVLNQVPEENRADAATKAVALLRRSDPNFDPDAARPNQFIGDFVVDSIWHEPIRVHSLVQVLPLYLALPSAIGALIALVAIFGGVV